MKIHTLQTSFATGQLDQAAQGRSETALYRNGAAALRNCEPFVTGGVRSRRGTRLLGDLPGDAVLAEFMFSLEQCYVAAFSAGRVDLYRAGDGSYANGVASGAPWTEAQLRQLRFAQLGDVMWIVHPDWHPRELVRIGEASWILRTMAFDQAAAWPTLRYAAGHIAAQTASAEQSVILLGAHPMVGGNPGVIGVGSRGRAQEGGGPWIEFSVVEVFGTGNFNMRVRWLGPAPTVTAGLSVQFVASNLFLLQNDHQPVPMPGTPGVFNSTVVAATPAETVAPQLAFTADWLQPGHLGTVVRVRDDAAGRWCVAEILEILNPALARVRWHGPAFPSGKATVMWEEQAASPVRGWFRSVCLYQQRLVFGGTRDNGAVLFMSKTGQFRNFGLGEAKDTDAIAVAAAAGVRSIRHVCGDGPAGLTVFTENGVSLVPVDKTKALTPSTIRLDRVAPYGASDARPGAFDGGVLFVLAGGNAVRDVYYSSEADNVQADPVSLPASGFLGALVDAAYLNSSNERAEELAAFATADGRIVLFHSIRSQKVGAWFEWTTPGHAGWSALAVAGQKLFAVARREPSRFQLEAFDAAVPFDACMPWNHSANPAPAPIDCSGMPVGSVAHAVDDRGDYLGEGVVGPGRTALVTRQQGEPGDHGSGTGWIGLAFDWWIDVLPPAIDLPDGTSLQRTQRLVRTSLRLLGAQSASVGAEQLVLRTDGPGDGSSWLDGPPPAHTGWWSCRHLGWGRPGRLLGERERSALAPRISRDTPLPVAVLSMKREVKA